jgi:SpoVK/Ycf46/Vps4 family AAA+-type ATPase
MIDNIFFSEFEGKKGVEYIMNCFNSLGRWRIRELLTASLSMVGLETGLPIIEKELRRKFSDEEKEELVDINELPSWITSKKAFRIMKKGIMPVLLKYHQDLLRQEPSETEKRILRMKELFDLNEVETEILSVFYLKSISRVVEYLFDEILDFSRTDMCGNYLGRLLGIRREAIQNALKRGKLIKGRLLSPSGNSIEIEDRIVGFISGLGSEDIEAEFFEIDEEEVIPLSEFQTDKLELDLMKTLLDSEEGCNILLYGAPGTGKTSFARSLARHLGKKLHKVRQPEDDDNEDLMRAIYATQNICPPDGIILVDEADDLLNSYNFFFAKNRASKGWINNFLDRHRKKIIWITNRISHIDPSTKRRFTFSLEFRPLTVRQRQRVLMYELEKTGCHRYLSREAIKAICKEFPVDASGIVDAARVIAKNSSSEEERVKKLRVILRSKEHLTLNAPRTERKNSGRSFYSIEGLNLSIPARDLVKKLESFYRHIESNREGASGMSILFYGNPGTGKTAFARYLGERLEREVIIRRGSDILSMWVGETEKNIARAFEEAERMEGILFFDEADSFLYPRSEAEHSWEKTFTNELLTWMENFRGLVIFATNEMEGLDHAAMRRFTYKVEFRELEPEGVMIFYRGLLENIVGEPLSVEDELRLGEIRGLTPGDFAVVKRKYLYEEPDAVTHAELISALTEELRFRRSKTGEIGFNVST